MARNIGNRKHYARAKSVIYPLLFLTPNRHTGIDDFLIRISAGAEISGKRLPILRRESKPKFFNRLISHATIAKILQRFFAGRGFELLFKKLRRQFADFIEARFGVALQRCFARKSFQLDTRPRGQRLHRFREFDAFNLFYEFEHVAALGTAEAVPDLPFGRDEE